MFMSVLCEKPLHRGYSSLSALKSNPRVRKIRHHIADSFGNWRPSNIQPHGRLLLEAQVSNSAQQQLGIQSTPNSKPTSVEALADTGAQMCVADWSVAQRMNLTRSDLLTPALTVSVADNANLELIGAQFISLTAHTGQSTQQLVYFAKGIGELYLSKQALIDLEVISNNFPTVGDAAPGSKGGQFNEVQDGSPSVLHKVPPQVPSVHQHQVPHHQPGPTVQVQVQPTVPMPGDPNNSKGVHIQQQNPDKSKGVLKDNYTGHPQVQVTAGSSINKVSGGFPSEIRQQQSQQVPIDQLGRELAKCG